MSAVFAVRHRPAGQSTVVAILLTVLAALWLYRDTALSLVELWGQSETFAHGYFVPVIVLWLLWRKRAALRAAVPQMKPAPSALLAVAAVAAFWLVGEVAEVNPARQFALVGLVVLSVPALAGWRTAGIVAFPLAFLFFAVPFGDFLLPWLMSRTADFTVLALRASGIPVYRDGLQFVIPSGTWSVVEACSGVRYLIASLMVGALFAYLNYRSLRRRWLFMLVALAVPIVANWIRAYMIVMIGHLSSNTLAVGVDHLIYGWLFFGVVIGLMFLIGARWSEAPDDTVPAPSVAPSGPTQRGREGSPWAVAGAMVVLMLLPLLVLRSLALGEDRSAPQLAALPLAADTVPAEAVLPPFTPAFTNPSATLERQYSLHERPVGLYIGYYRGQGPTRKLVSSVNALVHPSKGEWAQTDSGSRVVDLGERRIAVKTARLRRPVSLAESPQLVAWQFYWVNGTLVAGDAQAKAWGAWHRLLGRGDDGAVVVVYAAEQRPGEADATLLAFLHDHVAAIDTQLRKARDGD